MRAFLTAVAACGFLGLNAQGWNKRYDAMGQGFYQGAWNIETAGQEFMVMSSSYEPDTIAPDSIVGTHTIIMHQLSASGDVLFEVKHKRSFEAMYLGWANCCAQLSDSTGYVSAGATQAYDGSWGLRLLLYDLDGDTVWTRSLTSPPYYWSGKQIQQTMDGGFLICGSTNATGFEDGFTIRTDSQGNELWRETYGWTSPVYIDGFTAIAEAADGELYMSGSRFLSIDESRHWVQRTAPDGGVRWSVSWGGGYKEGATNLITLMDGQVLVCGGSGYGPDYTAMRPYLAKLDTADGSRMWEREYGSTEYSTLLFAAKECPNADIIACGVSYEVGEQQGLLLRASAGGDSLWMRTYYYQDTAMSEGTGRFFDVMPTQDGGFIAAGVAYNPANAPYPPGYSQDTWVVKVDSLGCIVPGCDGVGVAELITNLSGAMSVFPNPAHGSVVVRVDLPMNMRQDPDLHLSLVNGQGQVVVKEPAQQGDNTLGLSALSAGMYYVHLSSGTTWLSGAKLIVE